MVKPNAEGASKGISASSVVFDEASARAEARRLIERYRGSALVEEYIQGRELTVGLLAEPELRVLPPLEYVFLDRREYPVYGYYEKQDWRSTMRFDCPADLTEDERASIAETTLRAFTALGCRDVARFDTRLTKGGEVYVIECNPIPGIAPDWSDMSSIATAAGLDYRTLVRDILAGCIKRHRARARES